jgi:RNA 2',3'-cyclic 3'-phosphodiesterase
MQRKIFISLNLPDRVKKDISKATEEWQDLPVKWVKEPNLHVTLEFLGHVEDEKMAEICEQVCSAVKDFEMLDLDFRKIELAPDIQNPKMIWLVGETNDKLRLLCESIEKELGIYVSSKKAFFPHVTLGRIRQKKWQALNEIPVIEKEFSLVLTFESVDVMASEFDGDGQEYAIIQSCPLK